MRSDEVSVSSDGVVRRSRVRLIEGEARVKTVSGSGPVTALDFMAFAEQRSRDFTGRAWLFERIDRWLASSEGPRCFLIVGEPGSGKTAIAARLFEYSRGSIEESPAANCMGLGFLSATHFCSARDAGWTDPLLFVQSISQQLAQRYPDFNAALLEAVGVHVSGSATAETNLGELVGLYIKNLNVSGTPKPSSVFVQLVRSPLEALFAKNPQARVNILVDGLDEAEAATNQGDSIASLIAGTADFPAGFRFLVTTRPVPAIERSLRRISSEDAEVLLSKGTGESLSKRDVASYVATFLGARAHGGNDAAQNAIAEKAGANFLYAQFALRIFGETSAEKIDAALARLPRGLEALYLEFLDRLPDVKVRWGNLYRPILGTLAVAREPLTLTALTVLTPPLEETSVLDGVTALSQLLDAEGTPRTYRLYHQSFADFLEGETAEQYQCKASLFHGAIARAYDGKPLDDYAWRWLSYHLATAGRTDDLRRLLLDVSYLRGKLDATDAIALISDYDHLTGDADLRLIQGAIRLSAGVIAHDPGQFTSQLVGRLLPYRGTAAIRDFSGSLARTESRPWLRPLFPALHAPGTGLLRTLEGHAHRVRAVALEPDGRRIVSVDDYLMIKVWDLESGRELKTLEERTVSMTIEGFPYNYPAGRHVLSLAPVAVTPDGRRGLFGSDRTLEVWDLESRALLKTLEGHTDRVEAVALTPDGRRAVSGSSDRTLKVWDLESGRLLQTLEVNTAAVQAVAVTPDGRRAIFAVGVDMLLFLSKFRSMLENSGSMLENSGNMDENSLKVWDFESGRAPKNLEGYAGRVTTLVVTPDGRRAVSANGTLKVWDLDGGRILHTLEGITGSVKSVAVTPDGRRTVFGSSDKTVKVWDLESGRVLQTLEGHVGAVQAVAVTPDGRRAVSGSEDRTLKVWDIEGGRPLQSIEGHASGVWVVAVTPDRRRALSGSADNTLKLWDLDSGRVLRTFEGHEDWVAAAALMPDGLRALSGSFDNTLKIWDLESGRLLQTFAGAHAAGVRGTPRLRVTPDGSWAISSEGHGAGVQAVAVTPDGRHVLSGSSDRSIKVWDLESGRVVQTLDGYLSHANSVTAVAVTPDGGRAVSGSKDGTLKIWSLASGRVLQTLESLAHWVTALAVTPDGRRAVSGSDDRTLKVWDLESGLVLQTLEGHANRVSALALTPDGQRAVSGSPDKTIKVWDLESGETIATFSCDAPVWSCAAADARTIVAGDSRGRVYFLALEI